MPVLGIVLLILLFWLTGVFCGFSAALDNLSEGEVEKRSETGEKDSVRLWKLMQHPSLYRNAMSLLVIALGVLVGFFGIPEMTEALRNTTGVWILIPVLLLVIVLLAVFGILAFLRIGSFRSEKFAYRYAGIVTGVTTLLHPIIYLMELGARIAGLPFGVAYNQADEDVTEEEIISIVDEAHEQGVIEENEAEMIQNIISFNETDAGDIMTHRSHVIAFDEEDLLQEVVDCMLEEGNSRYPVYHENLDNIVGILNYKDALKFLTKNSWAKFKPLKDMPGLLRKADFIPETRSIGDLFHTMQARKIHMAIVVDEYGQTAGIVSMEDILEEIVGEILDEYDDEQEAIRTEQDNSMIIDGLANLEDVFERLGIPMKSDDFETLNGYLTSVLGHIPTKKDLDKEIVTNGYSFRVLSLGNKTIGKVKVEKVQ
ncbi:MAG: hemolysin family protein [Eubacteriales bacterium]|nr:hemolysin family protein [Eubacteriales bacterium]